MTLDGGVGFLFPLDYFTFLGGDVVDGAWLQQQGY